MHLKTKNKKNNPQYPLTGTCLHNHSTNVPGQPVTMQTFHLWHWECKLYWQCLMEQVEENMTAPVAFY